jgi:hypothetical protein
MYVCMYNFKQTYKHTHKAYTHDENDCIHTFQKVGCAAKMMLYVYVQYLHEQIKIWQELNNRIQTLEEERDAAKNEADSLRTQTKESSELSDRIQTLEEERDAAKNEADSLRTQTKESSENEAKGKTEAEEARKELEQERMNQQMRARRLRAAFRANAVSCIYIYIYIYIYTCICTCVYVCMYVCMCIWVVAEKSCTSNPSMRDCSSMCCQQKHRCYNTYPRFHYVYTYIYACIHTLIHTHTHTQTHKHMTCRASSKRPDKACHL